VTVVVAAGYLFHFIGYNLVGYAFASPGAHHDWVRGYNASIALLGLDTDHTRNAGNFLSASVFGRRFGGISIIFVY